MRKQWCVPMMTLCLLLCGCGAGLDEAEEKNLRQPYLTMEGCVMEAVVTEGMGTEEVISFTLRCDYTPEGASTVEVLAPETVTGIRAVVDGGTLSVVYEDLCLPAGTLSNENISPAACLPWLMDSLREGWLMEESEEVAADTPCLRLCLDESGGGASVESTLWLRLEDGTPQRGEIAVDGEIILTAEFTSFQFYDTIINQTGESSVGG